MSYEVDVGSFGHITIPEGKAVIAGAPSTGGGGPFVIPEYAQGRCFKLVPQLNPENSPGTSIIFFNESFSWDGTNHYAYVSITNNGKGPASVFILWMATPSV